MRRAIKKRVLLIEEDKNKLNKIQRLFLRDNYYQIIATASNRKEAFSKIDAHFVDCIFVNEEEVSFDINSFKEIVSKTYPLCKFKSTYNILEMKFNRILVDFDSFYATVSSDLKAHPDINHYSKYMLLDPNINLADSEMSLQNRRVLYEKYLVKVSNMLLDMGVPINTCGYKYLREAIMIGIESPIGVISITKSIYPNIAQKFSTSVESVERGMRSGLNTAWNCGGFKYLINSLGVEVNETFDKRPTNSKFVSFVVDRLRLEVSKIVD